MFEENTPRLFGLPPGADFAAALVQGVQERFAGRPPEAIAKLHLFVNNRRMKRRVVEVFTAQGAHFLPRIRLIGDLGHSHITDIPAAISPLRRRLQLTQLILRLLDAQPDIAPRTAIYDLAGSLGDLMNELHDRNISPETIAALDVSAHSAHWQRVQHFMRIIRPFFGADEQPDPEARQNLVVQHLVREWAQNPPLHPMIIAGSTGSRGATFTLMKALYALPQGAVILPGFDFDLPHDIWPALSRPDHPALIDHPQYHFYRLINDLGLTSADVALWHNSHAPHPQRSALISLSLRPAPVTDQWLQEGAKLTRLEESCAGLTLIEADSRREEAQAIALIMREAAQNHTRTALITPDRTLTRQVSAALDRWRITPDDSAGEPLSLTPQGRLLRHITRLMGQNLTAENLLIILKHPLVCKGDNRGRHLHYCRLLESELRKNGPPFPNLEALAPWAKRHAEHEPGLPKWLHWAFAALQDLPAITQLHLRDYLALHLHCATALARGAWAEEGSGELWMYSAGITALAKMEELKAEADAGGILALYDYRTLFDAVIREATVHKDGQSHPYLMIWGTLDARVQGVDQVILGSLNDGTWPELPAPDPWLNRKMRKDAGLHIPEIQIGLAALDYQQAVNAPKVILTRACRNDEAQAVPSRWINRLTNLLGGLPHQDGPKALHHMRARGRYWLDLARRLETPAAPLPKAPRPAPRPPVAHRPKKLSLTEIKTLIRDPYNIYAKHILRLKKLPPLRQEGDVRLRGTVLHDIIDIYTKETLKTPAGDPRALFKNIVQTILKHEVPWPVTRALWAARFERATDFFLAHERGPDEHPLKSEENVTLTLPDLDFTLHGRLDRVNMLQDGRLHLIDFKTGSLRKDQKATNKQLILSACLVERGAITGLGPQEVAKITYIGLGTTPEHLETPVTDDFLHTEWAQFETLVKNYQNPLTGYSARRVPFAENFASDYEHLSRYGEWDMSDFPVPEDMT